MHEPLRAHEGKIRKTEASASLRRDFHYINF